MGHARPVGWFVTDRPTGKVDGMGRVHRAKGFLSRLRKDALGNTLAIMAAAMIPLCGFAGSAIDMARIYVVRVRLQQACDAGVLAGRKFLPSGSVAGVPLTGTDLTQADTYFTNNLTTSWGGSGWYSGTPVFSPSTIADSNGATQVQGSASAVVPMTLMKMFGMSDKTVAVSCQARFDTPDTDVMFVLDNTGSMGCAVTDSDSTCGTYVGANTVSYTKADGTTGYYVKEKTSGGSNISRIDSLRTAVNTFYSTVATTMDPSTHVRYGFVPYTSTVNVGPLIYQTNPAYFVARASYQSRKPTDDYIISTNSYTANSASSQSACNALATTRTPAISTDVDGNPFYSYPTAGTAARKEPYWNSTSTSNGFTKNTCYYANETVGPVWTYQSGVKYNTAQYITGATITDPSNVNGATTTWNGCIEERQTTASSGPTASFNINSLPADLDPDLLPTSDATRWTPMWPDVEYPRDDSTGSRTKTVVANDNSTAAKNIVDFNSASKLSAGYMTCPSLAKLLFLPTDQASGATTISTYVSSLRAIGGTYHDTGMIWGARMLSSTGIFSASNAYPSGRTAPKKVVVFVTDGLISPNSRIYGMYGEEYMDSRVTGTYYGSNDPNNDANYTNSNSANTDWHTTRFLAECSRAKSAPMNADIWIVVVGPDKPSSMQSCASQTSQVLYAETQAQLTAAFQQIAQQIAMLRVSQ